jgi:hypothetical protein
MAVAPDQDVHLGPAGADAPDHVPQDERDLRPVRRLARAEDHGDRLARDCLIDVDRQEAPAIVVGVEERELLAAVDAVLGVVDVEHDAMRHLLEAVAEQLDHGRHHPLEGGDVGQVLEPAHGRLRAQVRPGLGRPAGGHLEGRIGAERVAVVGVGVAGGDQQHPEADHLGDSVKDLVRRPRVLDAAGEALRDPEPALDVREQQDAGIRGQVTAVEGGTHRFAGDGRWEDVALVAFHEALRGDSE